ncbi:ABC transporter permease [Shewanella dokdonensis]|uniref:ABC transporter permease n=1 Tax=Shewanella dokdonensis TaxID=712036 RepID=A0ABX8DC23_9GAMM|nr:ABC transporter permease [Shewanella dokdonensis]MCL1074699.1 ABC transporter permease [Shewanella dokdonensis]QVK22320.1 ABC transporter permease [Shewanella dokdonensis]
MKNILIKRLLQLLMMVWSVGSITFVLSRMLPGDMAYRIAAGRYGDDAVSAAAANAVRQELGLNDPVWLQYLHWLGELLQCNLGTSLVSGNPITAELQHQLGYTLLLAAAAMFLSAVIAIPLGLICGFRANSWLDRGGLLLSTLLRSQPVFCLGLLLILLFALKLSWFPVAGFNALAHLFLPALTLGLSLAALSNRVIRNSTLRVSRSDYYLFAKIKGLSDWQTFKRHGIRNIALPVVAFMGIQLVGLIEGVIMVESLFAWPGIGHALSHAVFSRDIPMLQGTALTCGVLFVSINTLVDGCCYLLDPRSNRTC